ncbi:hypothetical protein D3C85_1609650 [compost metagenome]
MVLTGRPGEKVSDTAPVFRFTPPPMACSTPSRITVPLIGLCTVLAATFGFSSATGKPFTNT